MHEFRGSGSARTSEPWDVSSLAFLVHQCPPSPPQQASSVRDFLSECVLLLLDAALHAKINARNLSISSSYIWERKSVKADSLSRDRSSEDKHVLISQLSLSSSTGFLGDCAGRLNSLGNISDSLSPEGENRSCLLPPEAADPKMAFLPAAYPCQLLTPTRPSADDLLMRLPSIYTLPQLAPHCVFFTPLLQICLPIHDERPLHSHHRCFAHSLPTTRSVALNRDFWTPSIWSPGDAGNDGHDRVSGYEPRWKVPTTGICYRIRVDFTAGDGKLGPICWSGLASAETPPSHQQDVPLALSRGLRALHHMPSPRTPSRPDSRDQIRKHDGPRGYNRNRRDPPKHMVR
ncbi:hypothetical protein BDK51DRAFT_47048 [Blyttiomyces helicus]|uniref:Uncharacterized protein n=1 Tax=Blyttiomyces helicus TaxID=388810 RepID=A0A4P9W4E9_9FUNG|nr:hypothetical protein BDK51DRAFT_47048 [Blyttiomyces helicus]|eukprot:RKO87229.1 hypothetical protein BDK51DRAFT_47048 [Blyttiomyces helicus]